MRFLLMFFSLLTPLAIGFLVVSVLWDKSKTSFSDLLLKCCLSVGFGFGISSCLDFLWVIVVGQLTRSVFIGESVLVVSLCILLAWQRQRRARNPIATGELQTNSSSLRSRPYLFRLAFCVSSVAAIICFLCLSVQDPNGQFDAYAHWNLLARFLYRGGSGWRHFAVMTWSHPDYPLLIPLSIARSWEFIGWETQLIPCAIALLFTIATVGIVATCVSRVRGERQGLLAGLVLLGTPFFIVHGASQYADVPLSFFYVATVALLFLYAQSPTQMDFLILGGMAAALSAWTKNEGILFAVLSFLLYGIVTLVVKGRRGSGRDMVALLIGAMPVIITLVVQKVGLSASNDWVSGQGAGSTLPRLLDMSRYHLVTSQFVKGMHSFGGWRPVLAMPLPLFFYFLLAGASVGKKNMSAVIMAVVLPVCIIVSDFFVYILTPLDLAWHLESSLNRLLLQIWPLAILAFFVIVRSPEQAKRAVEQALEKPIKIQEVIAKLDRAG